VSAFDCPAAEELAAFVEGHLSGGALERVGGHIDACPACLAAVQEFRPTDVVVSALRRGAAPSAPLADRRERYAPLHLHAAGGLGEVYVAEDTELGRRVALKRIRPGRADNPESRRRFLREAEVTARLEHPGIVPVHGLVWDAQGRPHYAMRLIDGESLRDAIAAFHTAEVPGRDPGERTLALRGLLSRFVAVCQTVAYAHSKGVVHRDLKPANVMLGQFGETLVVDWGLARQMRSSECGIGIEVTEADGDSSSIPHSEFRDPHSRETRPGAVIGTPAYMSPEQATGRHDEVGPASDIFMLGGTLYTILIGRSPFDGGAGAVRGEVVPPRQVNRSVPAALEAVCLKAMAGRPAGRYHSAAELGEEVERWLAGEPVRAHPERWPARAARWARRHRVAVGGLAAGLVVAAILGSGGGVWLAREAADRRAERARLQAKDHDAVEQAVAALPELARAYRFREAEGLLNQTAIGLSEFATAEDRVRLDDALADVRLAWELDAIRIEGGTLITETGLNITALDISAVAPKYSDAFERHGLHTDGEVDAVGHRVAASPVREVLVAALDDWLSNETDARQRDRLARIAKAGDPDPAWRDRFRDALARRDRDALRKLAAEADVGRLSPAALVALGTGLGCTTPEGIDVLERAQVHYPADYWLNFWLVRALRHNDRITPVEAIGYYRVCMLARPDSAIAHNSLGIALRAAGKNDQSEAEYRRAIELDPRYALAHYNLGNYVREQGDHVGAAACYRRATELDPKFASAHYNLGVLLLTQGDFSGAVTRLGRVLELEPGRFQAHVQIAGALISLGRFDDACTAAQRALDLCPPGRPGHDEAALRLREAEWILQIDRRLPAVLRGEDHPANVTEHAFFAGLAGVRRQYAGSARLYDQLFRKDPAAAESQNRRYTAACCAAFAGCGQGEDDPAPDADERARLRRQALDWLRADLKVHVTGLAAADPKVKEAARYALRIWQANTNLSVVRDAAGLEALPDDERDAWRQLWADVAAALAPERK
jgi:tetratricopeptide (TPR) repeat protein/tRNA A-37 threonylcarbamoyl transferase component Bud32